ncbi:MAG: hypothetical protein M3394_00670 [Actinomycetota bacterium]|nr:hypothetical protein [Actinomycetota bacterium]
MGRGRIIPAVLGATVALGLLVAASAVAQSPTTSPVPTSETSAPTTRGPEQTKVCQVPMPFKGEFVGDCPNTVVTDTNSGEERSWPSPFLVVVWVLIPLVLAVALASSRDESVVIAAVLALVLGWIGLLLVYGFLGRNRRDTAAPRPSA